MVPETPCTGCSYHSSFHSYDDAGIRSWLFADKGLFNPDHLFDCQEDQSLSSIHVIYH